MLKTIQNTTSIPQSLVVEGRQVVLEANEERPFDYKLADRFLDECFGAVIEVKDDFGSEFNDKDDTRIWLANMTGDPDAPSEITTEMYDSKLRRHVPDRQPNPIKTPRLLKEWAEGGQKQYTAKDGTPEALNLPGKWQVLPQFRRKQFDKGTAQWFMNRCSNATVQAQGYNTCAAIKSRPPSAFEPDNGWSLDDMRVYLKLTDADAPLGPTEAEIAGMAKDVPDSEYDSEDYERRVRTAKRECMKRIYFRLINPKYRLPTKKAFDEFTGAKKPAKRGPGRPRANA